MRRKVVTCAKCGATTPMRSFGAQSACPNCQTKLVRNLPYSVALAKSYAAHPNATPLQIGMKATFSGREYELVARVVLSTEEEGETYFWDEFLLVSEDNDTLFLDFDEGQWVLMEPYFPSKPVTRPHLMSAGGVFSIDDTRLTVQEAGVSAVRHLEGRFPYSISVGDRAFFADAKRMGTLFAIEWEGTHDEEVEVYRGRYLAKRDVYEAFGLKELVGSLASRDEAKRSQNRFAGGLLWLSLFAFFLFAYSYTTGALISQQSVTIQQVGPQGLRYGPFMIDSSRRIHRLSLFGEVTSGAAWGAAVLEAENGREIVGVQGEFWQESGSDSEGPWSERDDLKSRTDFIIHNSGNYYVHLYAQSDGSTNPPAIGAPSSLPTPLPVTGSLRYELHSGVIFPTYALWFGILTFLLSIAFFCIGNREGLAEMAANASD